MNYIFLNYIGIFEDSASITVKVQVTVLGAVKFSGLDLIGLQGIRDNGTYPTDFSNIFVLSNLCERGHYIYKDATEAIMHVY